MHRQDDDSGWQLLGLPIPGWLGDWLAELSDVRGALTIFWAGLFCGLLLALLAVLAGLWLTYT